MSTNAFTPAYLKREHTAPALLLSSTDNSGPCTWNEAAGRPLPTTQALWSSIQPQQELQPGEQKEEELEDEERYPSLPRPRGPEDYYKRVYDDLTKQIAYRWPNPGTPRNREGCIGGTWRHIKEVLGHRGSRCVFVDGLVRVYDDQKFTEQLQAQLPYRPHIRPLYAPFKASDTLPDAVDVCRHSFSSLPVLPRVPSASMIRDPNVMRKLEMQKENPVNRRGFYRFP